MRFGGKVVLISGAARGQGAAEARRFAAEGAAVVLGDVLDDEGAAVAADIVAAGGRAAYHHLDVTQPADWVATVSEAETRFGGLHILINNAGITKRSLLADTSLEDWKHILDVNLNGAFLGMKTAAPAMKRAGGGAIVNIASISGQTGFHAIAYAASKWGLIGLTKSVALDLVDSNIRVNSVSPGIVETPMATGASAHFDGMKRMTPAGRAGSIDEIVNVVLFLASAEASFMTGEDVTVDGGMMAGAHFRRVAQEVGILPQS